MEKDQRSSARYPEGQRVYIRGTDEPGKVLGSFRDMYNKLLISVEFEDGRVEDLRSSEITLQEPIEYGETRKKRIGMKDDILKQSKAR